MTRTYSQTLKVSIAMALIFVALSVLVLQSITASAASPNTQTDVLQDVADGSIDARDMDGPGGFGHVNFNQLPNGNLRIEAMLQGAEPNATYDVIVYCGPTHADAIDEIYHGEVTTNKVGNGNTGAFMIPPADQAGIFIPDACPEGASTGHVDFDNQSGTGTYVSPAGSITYTFTP